MTREQAERLWQAALATECVGGNAETEYERSLNPHFLAALGMVFPGGLYQNLSYRVGGGPGAPPHRVKVVAFLREWADALEEK
jgi:hypothetical protein